MSNKQMDKMELIEYLLDNYRTASKEKIVNDTGYPWNYIVNKVAKLRGVYNLPIPSRRFTRQTPANLNYIRHHFGHKPTKEIARHLGLQPYEIRAFAAKLRDKGEPIPEKEYRLAEHYVDIVEKIATSHDFERLLVQNRQTLSKAILLLRGKIKELTNE